MRILMLLLIPTCLLGGCSRGLDGFSNFYEGGGAPEPYGEKHVTPLGITFYWPGPCWQHQTPEYTASEIDAAFELDVASPGQLATWGRDTLLGLAKASPIQLVRDTRVVGDGRSGGYAGYCFGRGRVIEIALLATWYDPALDATWTGVYTLCHEWRHLRYGQFH